jgi:uncharacterized phosphosugar-binding protein
MGYLDQIIELLQEIRASQAAAIEQASQLVADTLMRDHLIYVFGPSHSSILAQELFFRAGGLVPVNPILPPGLTTEVRPITLTSRLERLPGFGREIIAECAIASGDLLIAMSVSGRNPAVVEVAQGAKARGATVIALTSMRYSTAVSPRAAGVPRLYEVADLVLDNCAPVGDALAEIPGLPQRVGPSSTVTGAAILNAVVARAAELLLACGAEPPIFFSANLDGGEERNQRWLEHYRGRLTYL